MKQEYLTRKKYEKPVVTVVKFAIERGLALSDSATNTNYQQGWNLLFEENNTNTNTNNYTVGNNWETI